MGDHRYMEQWDDGPLCPIVPTSILYQDPRQIAHRTYVAKVDEIYDAAPKTDDKELVDDDAYRVAVQELNKTLGLPATMPEYMRLYRVTSSVKDPLARFYIESWYFMCPICGLILPAYSKER